MNDERMDWLESKREELLDCPIFRVYRVERSESRGSGARGPIASFFALDAPNWVTVLPLLRGDSDRFVMVRQFRHGKNGMTVEFPAGTVEPGEDPATAARRELLEETGYEAPDLVLLGSTNPNPAFMNNTSFTYLALDPVPTGVTAFDEHERVHTFVERVDSVVERMGNGEYDAAIMVAALFLYERWKKRGADRIRTGA